MKKLRTNAKRSGKSTSAACDGALSHYHGALRSVRGNVVAAFECNAGHASTLALLRLLFGEGCKAKAVFSLAGSSQEGFLVAALESALER